MADDNDDVVDLARERFERRGQGWAVVPIRLMAVTMDAGEPALVVDPDWEGAAEAVEQLGVDGFIPTNAHQLGLDLAAEAVRAAIANRDEPPWSDLDPGIVDTVRVLWSAGFITTDSGDGRTKLLEGENDGSILPVPHVACRVDPQHLLDETDRAVAVLRAAGYHLHPIEGWHVEGTYNDGSAMVMAYGPEPPHLVEG